jgi:hypothetical protein
MQRNSICPSKPLCEGLGFMRRAQCVKPARKSAEEKQYGCFDLMTQMLDFTASTCGLRPPLLS